METLLATPVPDRLRLPKVSLFDGSGDPSDYLVVYSSWARTYGYPEAIWCRIFDTTLVGEAHRWWYRLPANSIGSWQDLRMRFIAQFLGSRRHLKNPTCLSRVKQGESESLQAWLQRFSKATIEVGHLSDDALLLAASSVVREDTPFAFLISKKPPRGYADFLGRARNYINAEASTSKKSSSSKASRGNHEGDCRKEMKRPIEAPVGSNR